MQKTNEGENKTRAITMINKGIMTEGKTEIGQEENLEERGGKEESCTEQEDRGRQTYEVQGKAG